MRLFGNAYTVELRKISTMDKLHRAREIHHEEGIFTLISKSLKYIRNRTQNKFWPKYYRIKSCVFGSHIVGIHNVLVDLDYEVFSPAIKKRLRRKKYEDAERELISTHLHRDSPVIDLGAGVGYTACVIDMITDDSTPIVAVEANKSLIPVIKRIRDLNHSNFNILHSAYDSEKDSVKFQVAEDFWSSSQYSREDRKQTEVTVPAASLGEVLKEYNLESPVQLIVDIEGGEHDLFVNEYNLLQNKVSIIIFEYHSFTENQFEYYRDILAENGFEFAESKEDVYVYKNANLY